MIEIFNIIVAVLSAFVIPLMILIVNMRTEIKLLNSHVENLKKFDDRIDKKLDRILDKLYENKG